MNNSKLVTALTEFAEGKRIETFGSRLNAIEHHPTFNTLKRIWNEGRGLISFATMDKETVLINELFCTKKEITDIKTNLKVPYEFVSLGYPDYYTKDLIQMRK